MKNFLVFIRQAFFPLPVDKDGNQTNFFPNTKKLPNTKTVKVFASEATASMVGRVFGFLISVYGLFEIAGRPLLEWVGLLQTVVC